MFADRKRAEAEKALALSNKSNLKKFFANVEARIYANLSKQLVDQMFGETSSTTGTVTVEGNTITYIKTDDSIVLTVVNEDGTTTEMTLPVNSFTF
jgi:DNA-binding LytR/AlgR family response regulator